MNIEEIKPTVNAETWVKAAFAKHSQVDGGSFAVVLDAEDGINVVKLTRSRADYEALVHFSGTSPHFLKIISHALNQGDGEGGPFHALMMEKLPETFPLKARVIADLINVQPVGKHDPSGLINVAKLLRDGEVRELYPASLADALIALGEYARAKNQRVELNQRANWGERADGTLVLFDLTHTRQEM